MKLAPKIFGRILAGFILALAVPFGVCAQESVVVSYDGYAGFQGPLWAAKDLELFRKHGLKAEMVLITGSTRGMAALISGSSDFAQGSASASIPIRLRGGDLVIVAAALNKFPFSVVAQKEIRKPSDLVGKKIGILNFGGSTDLAITLAFKEWNIPRNAVTIFASGGAPERFAALSSRAIDATVLSPPETIAAARMGMNILANLSDLKAAFPQTVMTVRRSYLEKNRETVKRFVRAYSEAIYEFKIDKAKGMAVYANRLKQQDAKVLDATYDYFAPKFSFPPRVDRGGIRNALELVSDRDREARGEINVEQFIDERVIDELEREGFFKKLR
ncbi:MAG TPA: ABC transporter substrate-binding protein [Methylomirabilota bacterium]|nr:ABC transporter substrate-binding protein [Methylomirabilota bacterium]